MRSAFVCSLVLVAVCVAAVASLEAVGTEYTRTLKSGVSNNDVQIEYNSVGVPSITADTEHDLFYAQGYVVAENRLWQMDFWRRFMSGTLSEVYGEVTVSVDIGSRMYQWREVCSTNYKNMEQYIVDNVEAYMHGVNDYLASLDGSADKLPPEYEQYGAPFPHNFTIIDTCLNLKGMSLGLVVEQVAKGAARANNAGDEVANAQNLAKVGEERFAGLHSRDPRLPVIIPPYNHSDFGPNVPAPPPPSPESAPRAPFDEEEEHDITEEEFQQTLQKLYQQTSKEDIDRLGLLIPTLYAAREEVRRTTRFNTKDSTLEMGLSLMKMAAMTYASNNWAISGKYTETGLPIVSGDPHLPYFAPSLWFLVGLHCTSPTSRFKEVFGATVIGAPGIGIGRNKHIIWAYTTNKADSQDLYQMVNVDGGYSYKNQVLQYVKTSVTIVVKGQQNVTTELTNSVYGPVMIDGDDYYSLSWAVVGDVDNSLEGMYLTNIAQNWAEYQHAASFWLGILFNGAYGDVEGNIGMQIQGKIPMRVPGDEGLVPKVGNGTFDWPGFIPFESMPSTLNPEQGFVVSANNPPDWPENLDFPMPGEYAPGFRAQRIIDIIMDHVAAGKLITVEDSENIQLDVFSLEFPYMYPALQGLQLTTSAAKDRLQSLLEWDGVESTKSTDATTFEDWVYCLWNVTSATLGASTESPWLSYVWFVDADDDNAPMCEAWGMTCNEYASSCFEQVVAEQPKRRYGLDHIGMFIHLPPLPLQWNRFVPVGGSHYTPNACLFTTHIPGIPQALVLGGPSMRMVIDASGAMPGQWILPIGENGDPLGAHYDDMLDDWSNGKYISMGWSS